MCNTLNMDTRTDIHRPSAIIPSDYQYVAIWTMNIQGIGDCEFIRQERKIAKAHMDRTKGEVRHYSHGSCGICGNVQAIYLVLFYHEKSNEYIVVGVDCAQKLEMEADFEGVTRFKKLCADAREQVAGKRKAIALLSDAGLIDAWEVYTTPWPVHTADCKSAGQNQYGDDNGIEFKCVCGLDERVREHDQYEERTIRDIVGKLIKYGNISDAQKVFVGKLLGNIVRRPIIKAQRAAEHEAAGPVPVGRVIISGTVTYTKEVERPVYGFSRWDSGSGYETVTKLIIRLDNGSKVYGSRFANLEKGDRVTFKATVKVSPTDTKFGFYSRPTTDVMSAADKKFVKTVAWG